jgi:hypothetical protein
VNSIAKVRGTISRFIKPREAVAATVYFLSTGMIAFLETLTWDNLYLDWGSDGQSWGFGQVYAIALLVAPLADLLNYLMDENHSKALNNQRPIVYMFSQSRIFMVGESLANFDRSAQLYLSGQSMADVLVDDRFLSPDTYY